MSALQRLWHSVTTREGNTVAARGHDYVTEVSQGLRADALDSLNKINELFPNGTAESGIWPEDMIRGHYPSEDVDRGL